MSKNHTMITADSEFMTVAEMQSYLKISQSAAYELTHRKDFPVFRVGSIIRIPRDAFYAWVESLTKIPAALKSTMQQKEKVSA